MSLEERYVIVRRVKHRRVLCVTVLKIRLNQFAVILLFVLDIHVYLCCFWRFEAPFKFQSIHMWCCPCFHCIKWFIYSWTRHHICSTFRPSNCL